MRFLGQTFEQAVQPHLTAPTFVTEYPTLVSPLAKAHADNPELTERFEVFIAGLELGNAFSELNDPEEQRRRLRILRQQFPQDFARADR